MKILSVDRDVQGILKSSYFKIPRFQRPYSWDKENIEDFWQDTIVDSGGDYFIGSMVLYELGNETFGVVDGQQRLTTMTILLAAIRDALSALRKDDEDSEKEDDPAAGLHQLVERPNINNKKEYVLQTEGSYPFFQLGVQKFPPKSDQEPDRDEEEAIQAASTYFREKIEGVVESVASDPSLSKARKRKETEKALLEIRDKILRLKLIFITVDDEDDAYVIFETLNTRGKDLTVADLVKNHILSNLKKENENVDVARDEWNTILERFEESQVDISVNSFILHSWLSRYDYVSEKKLFKDIKRKIKKNNVREYLDALSHESRLYREILEPSSRKWQIEELPMRDSIQALNTFRVRQPLPMVLSVMRDRDAKTLGAKQVKRALRAIEVFHFAVTAVTSQPSSGGISSMYALHARELLAAKTPQAKANCLDELITKLKQRMPKFAEFEATFLEIGFSDERTQQKALVQYILREFYKHGKPGQPVDFSRMTIEHLAGQATKSVDSDHVAMLGNLIYVDDDLNGVLGNKDFKDKKKLLKGQDAVWVDPWVLSRTQWTETDIEARARKMAKTAFNEVWTL